MSAYVEAPNPTEVLRRAVAQLPRLSETAFDTIANRRVLDKNIETLRAAGLFKVILAKRYGGFQHDLHTHLKTTEELATACGSTAWVTAVYQAHSWLMGLYPHRAQDDVFGSDSENLVAGVLAPRGNAKPVRGGYAVTGFYPFCSGCHHAAWFMFGALVKNDADEVIKTGVFLMEPDEVTIQDDWDAGGLAGTGSNSVLVDKIVVPEHRVLWLEPAIAGNAPGIALHDATLYRNALVPALTIFLTGPALGMARSACEHFITMLPGREITHMNGALQSESTTTYVELAEAHTKTDTARLLLHSCVAEMQEAAANNVLMPVKVRAKIRMDCSYAVRLCLEATELLYVATGGRGLANNSRIQLAAHDLHAINMHALFSLKTSQEIYGRYLLGKSPLTPLI